MRRWNAEWQELYVIYVPWDFPIREYPAAYHHLKQYEDRLARRPEVREGRYPWHALSRYAAQFADAFDKPKIIYPHFNTEPNLAYDEDGALSNDKTYIIPNAPLYLLGLLNSNVVNFFLHQICPSVQQGYLEFRTIYIEKIPVPSPMHTQRDAIESLVRNLLDVEGEGPPVAAWERELNALVYDVYGLTDKEVALIEEDVGEASPLR